MRSRKPVHLLAAAVVAAAVLSPTTAQAQSHAEHTAAAAKSAVVDALLRDLAQLEQKLLGLAEVIPESSYDWRPAEGVRSVGEVMMHVAADNYFLPTIAGVAAPTETGIKAGDYASVQAYERRPATKSEAIAATRASFAFLRDAMGDVTDADLAETLNVFGSSMTGTDLWVLTTTHLHEHLGQMIAYARSNAVVPPWSQ